MAPVSERGTQLADLLEPYFGRRLLGVVNGGDCIEVVFDGEPEDGNLLTLWFEDDGRIEYAHGSVAAPEAYARASREHGTAFALPREPFDPQLDYPERYGRRP